MRVYVQRLTCWQVGGSISLAVAWERSPKKSVAHQCWLPRRGTSDLCADASDRGRRKKRRRVLHVSDITTRRNTTVSWMNILFREYVAVRLGSTAWNRWLVNSRMPLWIFDILVMCSWYAHDHTWCYPMVINSSDWNHESLWIGVLIYIWASISERCDLTLSCRDQEVGLIRCISWDV